MNKRIKKKKSKRLQIKIYELKDSPIRQAIHYFEFDGMTIKQFMDQLKEEILTL